MMQTLHKRILFLFLALLLTFVLAAACGSDDEQDDDDDDDTFGDDDDNGPQNDFLDALPDAESLALRLPGTEEKALGELAKFYDDTVDMTRDTNEWILYFLSIIDEIASYPPTTFDGTTSVWGPVEGTGLEAYDWKFTMTELAGGSYQYQLEWRPKNETGDDAFVVIWEGFIEESSSTERRGIGSYRLDYTAANAIDPTIDFTGEIEVEYDTLTGGRRIDVEYLDFLGEEIIEPVNGTYHYFENDDGSGVFLFDVLADIHHDEYGGAQFGAAEHFWFNTRWTSGGAGRCDVVVTGGDLADMPEGLGWGEFDIEQVNLAECWGDDFLRGFYTEEFVLSVGGPVIPEGYPEGDEGTCAFTEELPSI
jgi:hypothetical protein